MRPFLEQQELFHGPTSLAGHASRSARSSGMGIGLGELVWTAAFERLGDAPPLVLVKFLPAGRRLERLEGLGIGIGPCGEGVSIALVVGLLDDAGELVDWRAARGRTTPA